MSSDETDFGRVLRLMKESDVEFILIGGLAAMAHGSARATLDVDVVYCRSDDNIKRISQCLAPYHPYMRGAPPGLPFVLDSATIKSGLNFTLMTDVGFLDILGEVVGGGHYEQLLPYTEDVAVLGVNCRCVTLERLILLKRAAGRPKDLEALAELQALFAEQNKQSN